MNKHKTTSLILFMACYCAYALVKFIGAELPEAGLDLSLTVICLMVSLIIWQQSRQDEFIKNLCHQAYVCAFWLTFIYLLALAQKPAWIQTIDEVLPIWTIPLLVWQGSYAILFILKR